ncbi:Na+:solute symporter [Flavihumibacter rivuli]|uniref:sodium:solute symporter family protein n=1 Tax=Flavihumibacter rivuli TaxID=2838156 RepID=UPI001BDDD3C7|nr:sodium:solute symporter family protein [Flavihumibacter rivuli]ULQ56596.1 Na+:solute symporter [Flavihumibacter rivuli]
MRLSLLDVFIMMAYLVAMLLVGWLYRKKAGQNVESYLMGGKSMPWYWLGLSNASDMFDISGTMWMVTLCFVYGFKSAWIPWLWPVFNQVFMMMFLSQWLRRSNANTGAEWLASRFGKTGPRVKGSHIIIVVFALLSCLGFLAYGFIGLGKFMEIFIPWELVQPYLPFQVAPEHVPHLYGIICTLVAMLYTIMGGLHSIVLGDAIKYVLLSIGSFAIAFIAMKELQGGKLVVPDGWTDPFFGWELGLNWSPTLQEAQQKIQDDGFGLFGVFFMMMVFKGVFASLAGPAPNYDMQKILSTRSPGDAAKMSGIISVILLPVRYAMIMGITVLALLHYKDLDIAAPGGKDFERLLPAVINQYLPAGLLGLVLTGLLGAFMGTFSGTLNAAQAYITNDIYLKYINPRASDRSALLVNYMGGTTMVVIGIILGVFARDVNSVVQWIVAALYGGYIAANLLKWYWWRFNASGFYWGMLTGILASLVFPYFTKGLPLFYWPWLFLLSLAGSIAGTFKAPPVQQEVLKHFYKTVRPWGWWKPIHEQVVAEDPGFVGNKRMGLDLFNVLIGIIGQTCLTLLPMYLVLWMEFPLLLTVFILLLAVVILKFTWWNKLEEW